MAGDWIKMRTGLRTDPDVVRIMSALKADKLRTLGALFVLWTIADAHCDENGDDGVLVGYTPEIMDAEVGLPGFTEAAAQTSWLSIEHNTLVFPGFTKHNGRSAKRRASDATRKKNVRKMSAPQADKKRTREEKRREEFIRPPYPPSLDTPAFREKFAEYLDWRSRVLRKPWKSVTVARNLASWADTHPPQAIIAAIDHAMRNEYQGVFPGGNGKANHREKRASREYPANTAPLPVIEIGGES